MTTSPDWSWKRALAHAGLTLLAYIIVGATTVAIVQVANPRKLGEAMGQLGVFVALVGFGASWAVQSGRKKLGIGLSIVAGVLVVVVPIIAVVAPTPVRLPADVRADFERDGDRLRHPALGVSIAALPDSYKPSHELAKGLIGGRQSTSWAWMDAEAQSTVMVAVEAVRTPPDEQAQKDMLAGAWKGFTKAATDRGLEVEVTPSSTGRRKQATMAGMQLGMRAEGFSQGGSHYLLLMAVMTSDAKVVDTTLDGLQTP